MVTTASEIHLYDDPKSKIRFLETTLGDNEWRASIHLPQFDAKRQREVERLERQLNEKGYYTKRERGDDGHLILHVYHPGTSPDIPRLFREHGLTHGAGYVIRNPAISLKALLDGVGAGMSTAKDYVMDPARANGLIFLTAEAFLILAAGGAKHGAWYEPKNLLQGMAGALFASQSAAYLFWAKKADERIASGFQTTLQHIADGSFERLPEAEPLNAHHETTWLEKGRRLLEDYPIQAGALLNNAGMVAYMAHAVLERSFRKKLLLHNPADKSALHYLEKGFARDIRGALISIIGWSSLMLTPKEYQQKSDNPLTKIWQSFRENPQALTSLTSVVSSSQRLMGAHSKGNWMQLTGESLYIPGDILLFFVKNHEYGGSRHGGFADLVDKIHRVIEAMPVVAGPSARQSLLTSTAAYLAKQIHALEGKSEATDIQRDQRIIETALQQQCNEAMAEKFDYVIGAARRMIDAFPDAQQSQIGMILSHVIPRLSGIVAHEEELQRALCVDVKHRQPVQHITPIVDINRLSPAISQLVFAIPGPYAGDNALKLYDALAPFIQQSPDDKQRLEDGMIVTAKQQLAMMKNQPSWAERSIAPQSAHARMKTV